MKQTGKGIIGLVVLFMSTSLVFAADNPQRLITVTGDAEVMVAPDRATILFGVETWNKDLDKAMQENDARIKNIITILKQEKISGDDIQTGYFNLEPTYETRYDEHHNPTKKVLTGYQINKNMTVTIRDLTLFEKIMSAVHKNGANRIDGLEFRNSELRKYRDQARAMAIRAAKEKAEALVKEIGQSIGKACSIREEQSHPWYPRGLAQNVSKNMASESGGGSSESSIAPGKISVNTKIEVSFELL